MLLQHAWLASLSKPPTISEDDEEEAVADDLQPYTGTEDKEVGEWVVNALERKKNGLMGVSAVPALHKAPLVSPAASPG